MKVYVVTREQEDESEVVDVMETEEEAKELARKLQADDDPSHWYDINKFDTSGKPPNALGLTDENRCNGCKYLMQYGNDRLDGNAFHCTRGFVMSGWLIDDFNVKVDRPKSCLIYGDRLDKWEREFGEYVESNNHKYYCNAHSESLDCCLEMPWIKQFIRKIAQESRQPSLSEPIRELVKAVDGVAGAFSNAVGATSAPSGFLFVRERPYRKMLDCLKVLEKERKG